MLDANESPFGEGLNRYPDPYQRKLKEKIAGIKNIPDNHIFLGNGSDEGIDLLIRIFCEPGQDSILTFTPGYSMYKVSAEIQNAGVLELPLTDTFQLPMADMLEAVRNPCVKLIFLTSPNNPTGNCLDRQDLELICQSFDGMVVVDEAYIDFCPEKSALELLNAYPNLIVLQTLSKGAGMAGVRLGMAFAQPVIVELLNKVKPPYNLSRLAIEYALENLDPEKTRREVSLLNEQRAWLEDALKGLSITRKVYPSEANFLLVEFEESEKVFQALLKTGILVRNMSKKVPECLRLTIGTPDENKRLMEILKKTFGVC
jgi:histidinol-phosphate aminotransferase